mgnify:CR=1 FL=1|tara:strand:+ start:2825 stop:3292 length:468 start_codon:yes stop_codon:yes gene_type:complete
MRFSENFNLVHVAAAVDGAGGVTGDSIDMGTLHSVAFLVSFGALTGDAVLTAKSGASAGTQTTAETMNYRLADAVKGSATADTYGAWATSTSLTLTAATYANKTLIVEIDSQALTDGQPWLTLAFSSAASELLCSVVSAGVPRYKAHDIPTSIGA